MNDLNGSPWLFVDTREQSGYKLVEQIKLIQASSKKYKDFQFHIKLVALPVGDYLLLPPGEESWNLAQSLQETPTRIEMETFKELLPSKYVLFELKKDQDLHQSIIDQRLVQQVGKLLAIHNEEGITALLLESPTVSAIIDSNYRFLNSSTLFKISLLVPVVFVHDIEERASLFLWLLGKLAAMNEKEVEWNEVLSLHTSLLPKTKLKLIEQSYLSEEEILKATKLNILCSIPGIGQTLASRILDHVGWSLETLRKTDDERLAKNVKGLSRIKAKKIKEALS